MASEDLLKKAVAAFNALSPEQQAQMMDEQRKSWVRGNVGLSRDERGMTSPVMPRFGEPGPMLQEPYVYEPLPAPAATDTGLETVGDGYLDNSGRLSRGSHTDCIALGFRRVSLVDRSQAEELLAAKDKQIALAETSMLEMHQELNKLEADNAAQHTSIVELEAERSGLEGDIANLEKQLAEAETDNAAKDARVKELVQINANLMGDDEDKPRYTTKRLKQEIARATEALEAKLAAATDLLTEAFEELSGLEGLAFEFDCMDRIASFLADRAVLGGKPS